jgi:hypothetical protein
MKVVVINFSGNVGKSTIAAHMLKPRMGDPRIFSVESLNIDSSDEGVDVERIRGSRFVDLVDEVMREDSAIVDVGASNAEAFMKGMRALKGAHDEFDYFVVPTVSTTKQIGDTVNTVVALNEVGVRGNRIRVLFNRVEEIDDLKRDFAALFQAAEQTRLCVVSREAAVEANEVFERLRIAGRSLAQVCSDDTPWRTRFRDATNEDERSHAMSMLTLKRLSSSAKANLDNAFGALFA